MDPFLNFYKKDLLSGYCTQEGTKEYFNRLGLNETSYSELDKLKISRIGFGSYRIFKGNSVFNKALEDSLLHGVNLIDTSTNYGDGSSESLIGDVLEELIDGKKLSRSEVFVVSKIGYIQGRNLDIIEEKNFSDITYYDTNCYHCISPDFLEDQLERSRKRLGLNTIDAILLHNPEYFLMDREKHNVEKDKAIEEYYLRIERAFEFLEEARQKGVIRYYGISSNTFPVGEKEYTHTSLNKVLEIVESVRIKKNLSNSGFRIIQFPANLYEMNFAFEKNNSGKTILEIAKEKNLFTLINRPLNAIAKSQRMDRLAIRSDININQIENKFEEYKKNLKYFQENMFSKLEIEEEFTFLSILENYKNQFQNVEHFRQSLNYNILPHIRGFLNRVEKLDREKKFYKDYVNLLNQGIQVFEVYLEACQNEKIKPLYERVKNLYSEFKDKTLSQISVYSLLQFNGVNSVLVGMRRTEYVNDILPILSYPSISIEEKKFQNLEV